MQETALWDLFASYRGHVHQMVKVSGKITCCVGGLQVATTIQKIEIELDGYDADTYVVGSGTSLITQDLAGK